MKTTSLTLLFFLALISISTHASQINEEIELTKKTIAQLQAKLQKLQDSLAVNNNKTLSKNKETGKDDIKVHSEFGFIHTSGNTDTLTYNLDTKIQKSFAKHELTFLGDGEYGEDTNTRTKNKYYLELDYGYQLDGDLYFEYISAYKFDEFSGFDYQVFTGPGLKYKVIVSDKQNLDLSSTLLFSSDKKESDIDAYNYTSYRAKIEYSLQVLKNLKFEETLTYRTDVTKMNDYFIYSKTALTSKISDVFSVGLSYKIDYINLAEIGKQKADKTLSANLIADF